MVCLGNVCRSPTAERLLRAKLAERPPHGEVEVEVASAGVRALVGAEMDGAAADELRRLGGDPAGFRSTQLTPRMVAEADLVLTATRELRSRVLEEEPRALRRTFTIREFAALVAEPGPGAPSGLDDVVARAAAGRGTIDTEEYDVPDPIGQPAEVYRHVADMLDEACETIARALAGASVGDLTA